MTLAQAVPFALQGQHIHRPVWTDGRTWSSEGSPLQLYTYYPNGTKTSGWSAVKEDGQASDWAITVAPFATVKSDDEMKPDAP